MTLTTRMTVIPIARRCDTLSPITPPTTSTMIGVRMVTRAGTADHAMILTTLGDTGLNLLTTTTTAGKADMKIGRGQNHAAVTCTTLNVAFYIQCYSFYSLASN